MEVQYQFSMDTRHAFRATNFLTWSLLKEDHNQ
jgi:hypothetical protein